VRIGITGETARLRVPGEEDAVTIDFVPSVHFVQHVTQLGRPSIAHATPAGKVMLACAGRSLPRGPFEAYTSRRITNPEALAAIIPLQGPAARFGRAAVRAGVAPLLEHARAISEALGVDQQTICATICRTG
jgi:DNA-binding IclR family transcriptional regulator